MKIDKMMAQVKKLLGNPVVAQAAGALELAEGQYKLSKSGLLYIPHPDYTGGAQAAEKTMYPFKGAANLEYPNLGPIKEEEFDPSQGIQGKHFDTIVADDPIEPLTATQVLANMKAMTVKMAISEEEWKAYLDAPQLPPVYPSTKYNVGFSITDEMLKDDLKTYPGKVFFENDHYRTRESFTEQRVKVLEAMCAALLLGKDDTTYTLSKDSLEEASRLFNVRVTYYPEDETYHIGLD